MAILKWLPLAVAFISLSLLSFPAAGQDGNCNEADLDYLSENLDFVQSLVASCGTSCLQQPDPEACLQECLQTQTPLSVSCIECFNEQMNCAIQNCFFPCGLGTEEDCAACLEENCIDAFFVCAGIVDNDNDGFTNLEDCDDMNPAVNPEAEEIWYDGVDQNCDGLSDFDQDGDGEDSVEFGGLDCDDQNPESIDEAFIAYTDQDGDGFGSPQDSIVTCTLEEGFSLSNTDCNDSDETIYPGAPGTAEGIDNNCNGFLDEDELPEGGCVQDLDSNGSINSADLLLLLSDFGCDGNCTYDLNTDSEVNASDLLLFLSVIGSECDN
ncbi:putative metal-binding motif-containing protein [Halocola ammonii]